MVTETAITAFCSGEECKTSFAKIALSSEKNTVIYERFNKIFVFKIFI